MIEKSIHAAIERVAINRFEYRLKPIQTTHLRTAAALQLNVEHFIRHYGVQRVGFMTLTFKASLTPNEAVDRLKRLVRKMKRLFRAWTWVMELKPHGRPHFHLLVATSQNIRNGFDCNAYDTLRALDSQARSEKRPLTPEEVHFKHSLQRRLKANPALTNLRRAVRKLLGSARSNFGYVFELTPLRKTPDRVAGYMKKNYLNAVKERHGKHPGVHLTASSRHGPKVCWSSFTPLSSKARRVYSAIAAAVGIPDMETMKLRYGPRWSRDLEPVIDELTARFCKDPKTWPTSAVHRVFDRYMTEVAS